MFESKVERNEFVVNSLLDCDFYKFTMGNYFFEKCNGDYATYEFKCRTPDINLNPFIPEIKKEIKHLQSLHFKDDEIKYLRTLNIFTEDYLNFLEMYQMYQKSGAIDLFEDPFGNFQLILRGPLYDISMYEIYLLKIISEVYYRNTYEDFSLCEGRYILQNKIDDFRRLGVHYRQNIAIAEFGTRRSFSGIWQEEVISELKDYSIIKGTSNVLYAKEYDLTPIGTNAHEFYQCFQGKYPNNILDSQKIALEEWIKFYRCKLGIALSDTLGDNKFLKDFDIYFARLYDGLRHDSGNPAVWARKILNHYKSLNINPEEKTLIFSDNLNYKVVEDLYCEFVGCCNLMFGIGTNFTNDVGIKPIQVVIKQTYCNGNPTAKLSNDSGKTMCKDEAYLEKFKKLLETEK